MKAQKSHNFDALVQLLNALIDQEKAEIIVPAEQPKAGFWFGGGKLAADQYGTIWLSGRYRNAGDSRTGLEAGVRGTECAIFRSDDGGTSFTKVSSWSKADLASEAQGVISIEGTALHQRRDGKWELYISIEKKLPYPDEVRHYQKPGTGVWSIELISGPNPETLDKKTLEPVLANLADPAHLHVKDPVVYDLPDGSAILVFCSHPFNWTSDNSGYARCKPQNGSFDVQSWEMVSRGATWDVAVTRITSRLPVPKLGCFAQDEPASVFFYDGAECMRPHQENKRGHRRPRGYSCEEIGGAFFGWDASFPKMTRLSRLEPLFVSPWGTGASRYVDCIVTDTGILATWKQSQEDGSQSLVRHFLPMDVVGQILRIA